MVNEDFSDICKNISDFIFSPEMIGDIKTYKRKYRKINGKRKNYIQEIYKPGMLDLIPGGIFVKRQLVCILKGKKATKI
ncbi:MAG: hypothetical protein SOT41_03790 [Candidatus Faecisoma sp.]|nr:hypothetical protein [Acholeplasma sp.]MDY2892884.1 hypothetical protein [Candidatus Faecisoma sp.]